MLSRSDARAIIDEVLSYSKADETEVSIGMGVRGNLRFACNVPTTTGESTDLSLEIRSVFGRRVGSYSTTQADKASLKGAVARAEELARLAPENPEYMPRLGAQQYLEPVAWDEATSKLDPAARTRVAGNAIEAARAGTGSQGSLVAAGFYENGDDVSVLGNSRGLFAYGRATSASYTITVRTPDGSGSGWAAGESFRAGAIDDRSITARAIEKARRSEKPGPIDPGTYTVILEPSAVGDMLNLYRWNLGRRAADEGRSYFTDPSSGTRIGQKLFDDRVTIYSDPMHPLVPSSQWGDDGQPLGRTMWAERGVQRNLTVGRFWAQKKNLQPLPGGSNLIMEGEDHSLEDLIASTDRGLLVTSFWYIRQVDPKTILYTGLTRDGVFLIEKGRIVRPVINLRWNDSPVAVFKGIEMMGRPERVVTREGNAPMLAPPLKVKEFHFTSVSTST